MFKPTSLATFTSEILAITTMISLPANLLHKLLTKTNAA